MLKMNILDVLFFTIQLSLLIIFLKQKDEEF